MLKLPVTRYAAPTFCAHGPSGWPPWASVRSQTAHPYFKPRVGIGRGNFGHPLHSVRPKTSRVMGPPCGDFSHGFCCGFCVRVLLRPGVRITGYLLSSAMIAVVASTREARQGSVRLISSTNRHTTECVSRLICPCSPHTALLLLESRRVRQSGNHPCEPGNDTRHVIIVHPVWRVLACVVGRIAEQGSIRDHHARVALLPEGPVV